MNPRLFLAAAVLALGALGSLALGLFQERVLDAGYHHLGDQPVKDWPEASVDPEGKRLEVPFDSKANTGEWTLFLEQRSIDNVWRVRLNGVEVARLKPLPELTTKSYALPPGSVQDGKNVLAFEPDVASDDVVIGNLRLVEKSLRELFDTRPVRLTVRDASGAGFLPARVTFTDASGALAPLYYAEAPRTAVRQGTLYVADAEATLELPPGEYTSYASRGPEWSRSRVTVQIDGREPVLVEHHLRRELDTQGFIAADTHLHTLRFSGHGDASVEERQVSLAGEGVELAVATDHNHQTDYRPYQRDLALTEWYTTVVGNEVTTKVGHFNGFPLDPKAPVPDHESKDYVTIVDGIRARGAKVVILNHPRWPSYDDSPFTNEKLDHATGAFASGLKLTVDATEMINATTSQPDPLRLFQDWFALLSRGERIFAVGSSDSHTVGDPPGQGRTYVPSATDDPAKIDVSAACEAIKNGHTSIGMGLFVTVVADGRARMGETLTHADRAQPLHVELRVQAPSWIVPRKAHVFLNGARVAERDVPAVPGEATDARLAFDLPLGPRGDRWLVCVVTGDPADGPFWPSLNPYSLGATNPVFVDLDGDGWQSPRESAARAIQAAGEDDEALGRAAAECDEATALHLLDLGAEALRRRAIEPTELRRRLESLAARMDPAHTALPRFLERF